MGEGTAGFAVSLICCKRQNEKARSNISFYFLRQCHVAKAGLKPTCSSGGLCDASGMSRAHHYVRFMVHVVLETKSWALCMPGYAEQHPQPNQVILE